MSASENFPTKPQPKPKPGSVMVVRALFNYTARHPDELSFKEDDILYVFDRSNPEWWKAKCCSKTGLIPSNYVETKLDKILDPLHEAARRGNLSFLKECLSHKVSSTSLDSMGNTPLYWASHSGHLDCVLCLLNEQNPPLNVQNRLGDTPLHGASARGHFSVVETLLKAGADPSVINANEETPDMLAMSLDVKNLLQKYKLRTTRYSATDVNPEAYEDDSD